MYIFKTIQDLQTFLTGKRSVGFVPTMGALHPGHISLIDRCSKETDWTVCSIFVNPTQFNNKEDFEKYPITIKDDILLLERSGCDVLFIPSVPEMYPKGIEQTAQLDLGHLDNILEGAMRPGHYNGVAEVVERLIEIVRPNKMYMGLKDFQQILVVKKMITLKGLNVEVISCETVREESGLAMSSRNMRLSASDKLRALEISRVLFGIKNNYPKTPLSHLIEEGTQRLAEASDKLEYLECRDADTLEAVHENSRSIAVLTAAWFGGVRLIDNIVIQK